MDFTKLTGTLRDGTTEVLWEEAADVPVPPVVQPPPVIDVGPTPKKITKGQTAPAGIIEDVKLLFERGGEWNVFGFDVKNNVVIGAYGDGPAPLLRNTKTSGYPTLFLLKGENIVIENIDVDGGNYKELRVVSGAGCANVRINNLRYVTAGTFFHWNAVENVVVTDCGPTTSATACLKYGEYFEHQSGKPRSGNVSHAETTLIGGPNAHDLRVYGADDCFWTDCTIGNGKARSAVTLKDGWRLKFTDTVINGNVGPGDNIPNEPPFKVVAEFRRCDITLKDASVFAIRRDSLVLVEDCKIKTPVTYAIELKSEGGYAEPSAIVTNNAITGPPSTVLLKGLTANAQASGNTINGVSA